MADTMTILPPINFKTYPRLVLICLLVSRSHLSSTIAVSASELNLSDGIENFTTLRWNQVVKVQKSEKTTHIVTITFP
jgi:hypothetical protein